MAITFISQGTTPTAATTGTGTTSVTAALPGTLANGDMVLLYVGNKPDTVTPPTPTGWTLAGTIAGGTGSQAADTGPVRTTVFYRVKDASWSTMPAVTLTGNSAAIAQAFVYRSTTGIWSITASGGADTTGDATWSVTTATDPGFIGGDLAFIASTIPTDITTPAQFSVEAISSPGITYGTMTERSEPETTSGNQVAGFIFDRPASSGTSVSQSVVTATATGTLTNVTGTSLVVRVREEPTPTTKTASDGGSIAVADAFVVAYGGQLREWDFEVSPSGTTLTTTNVVANDQAVSTQVAQGSGTVQSSNVQTQWGNFGVRMVTPIGSTTVLRLPFALPNRQGAVSVYQSYSATMSGNAVVMSFRSSIGYAMRVYVNSTNKIFMDGGSGGTTGSASTGSLTPGTMYRWEVVFDTATAGTGSATLNVYAGDTMTVVATCSLSSATIGAATLIDTLELGAPGTPVAQTMYIDSVQMRDGVTSEIGPNLQPAAVPSLVAPVVVGAPTYDDSNNTLVKALTIPQPSGLQDGDILVAILRSSSSTQATDYNLAGWTRRGVGFSPNSAAVRASGVFTHYVTSASSEPANYVFTSAGNTHGRMTGMVFIVRPGPGGSPWGAEPTYAFDKTFNGGPPLFAPTSGSPMPVQANSLAIWGAANDLSSPDATTMTPPSGTTLVGAHGSLTNQSDTSTTRAIVGVAAETITGTSAGGSSKTVAFGNYSSGWLSLFAIPGTDSSGPTTITASDTGSIAVAETSDVSNTQSTTDTGAVGVTETSSIDGTLTASESRSLAITETSALFVTLSSTDASSIAVSETSLPALTVSTTDTGSLAIAETSQVSVTIASTDTGSIAVADTSTSALSLTRTDTGAVTITDASTVFKTITATDTASIAVNEVSGLASTVPGTDAVSVGVTEQTNLLVSVSTTDTSSIAVTESTNSALTVATTDTGAVSVADSSTASVNLNANDTSAVSVTESNAQFIATASTDTSAVSITETTAFVRNIASTDTSSIAVAETASIYLPLPGTDTGSIAVGESSNLVVSGSLSVSGTDTSALVVSEAQNIAVGVPVTDTTALGATETRAIASTGTTTDSSTIAVGETSLVFKQFVSSDSAAVSVTESSAVTYIAPGTDTGAIGATESSSIVIFGAVIKTASDTTAVSTSENTSRSISVFAADTSSVQISDVSASALFTASGDTSAIHTDDSVPGASVRSTSTTGVYDNFTIAVTETTNIVTLAGIKEVTATDESALGVSEFKKVNKPRIPTDIVHLETSISIQSDFAIGTTTGTIIEGSAQINGNLEGDTETTQSLG